jgi:hypothetical protein
VEVEAGAEVTVAGAAAVVEALPAVVPEVFRERVVTREDIAAELDSAASEQQWDVTAVPPFGRQAQ